MNNFEVHGYEVKIAKYELLQHLMSGRALLSLRDIFGMIKRFRRDDGDTVHIYMSAYGIPIEGFQDFDNLFEQVYASDYYNIPLRSYELSGDAVKLVL